MRLLLKCLVFLLERGCCLFHWVPGYQHRLADWSFWIDQRFKLGEWTDENRD